MIAKTQNYESLRRRVERSEEDLGDKLKDFQTLEEDKMGKD